MALGGEKVAHARTVGRRVWPLLHQLRRLQGVGLARATTEATVRCPRTNRTSGTEKARASCSTPRLAGLRGWQQDQQSRDSNAGLPSAASQIPRIPALFRPGGLLSQPSQLFSRRKERRVRKSACSPRARRAAPVQGSRRGIRPSRSFPARSAVSRSGPGHAPGQARTRAGPAAATTVLYASPAGSSGGSNLCKKVRHTLRSKFQSLRSLRESAFGVKGSRGPGVGCSSLYRM